MSERDSSSFVVGGVPLLTLVWRLECVRIVCACSLLSYADTCKQSCKWHSMARVTVFECLLGFI